MRERVVDRTADADQRIAEGAVEVEQNEIVAAHDAGSPSWNVIITWSLGVCAPAIDAYVRIAATLSRSVSTHASSHPSARPASSRQLSTALPMPRWRCVEATPSSLPHSLFARRTRNRRQHRRRSPPRCDGADRPGTRARSPASIASSNTSSPTRSSTRSSPAPSNLIQVGRTSPSSFVLKSIESQESDRQRSAAFHREIGKRFTDDRCELEAVAAESARDRDAIAFWIPIDDEMAIGRRRVHARFRCHDRAGIGHEYRLQRRPYRRELRGVDRRDVAGFGGAFPFAWCAILRPSCPPMLAGSIGKP